MYNASRSIVTTQEFENWIRNQTVAITTVPNYKHTYDQSKQIEK